MAHEVFISYSSRDRATADAVCAHLEATGVSCWIAPRDIVPGKQWATAIVEAIQASRLMVVVLSTHSNTSEQVLREVERAVHHVLPIIPFRIDDFELAAALSYYLSTPHWLNANDGPLEAHLLQLTQTARTLLNVDNGPNARPAPTGTAHPFPHQETAEAAEAVRDAPAATPTRPRRRSPRTWVGIAGGTTLAVAAIIAAVFLTRGSETAERVADASPPDSATTPVASPAPGAAGALILRDDFEDPAQGWLLRAFEDPARGEFAGGYQGGVYVVRTVKPVTDRGWTIQAPGTLADATISVDVRLVGDTPGRRVGLTCRRQSSGNEYRFALNIDRGTYSVLRLRDNRITELVSPTPAADMLRGNRLNHLELSCAGTTITPSLNGIVLPSVSDPTFKEGRYGIYTGTAPGAAVTVEAHFDNLVLSRL